MSTLEGKTAPAFSLAGSDGKTHSPADFSGKTVVLYFYPKDDTPGCTKEACAFRDYNAELTKAGVVVLGVSGDSTEKHGKFIAKHDLNFVLLTDPDTEMMKTYGAWGEKSMYGKTYDGIIRSTVVIDPEGTVIKHWPKVSRAATHPKQVMEFLELDVS